MLALLRRLILLVHLVHLRYCHLYGARLSVRDGTDGDPSGFPFGATTYFSSVDRLDQSTTI